jgi:hypothetical protein
MTVNFSNYLEGILKRLRDRRTEIMTRLDENNKIINIVEDILFEYEDLNEREAEKNEQDRPTGSS